jgi:hypothetical protein
MAKQENGSNTFNTIGARSEYLDAVYPRLTKHMHVGGPRERAIMLYQWGLPEHLIDSTDLNGSASLASIHLIETAANYDRSHHASALTTIREKALSTSLPPGIPEPRVKR